MKSKYAMAATLALAAFLGLAGCDGDDGRDGAAGAPGAVGPEGPEGPVGPPGDSVVTLPLESCAVCHSEGSYASAPAAHELSGQGAFADFEVAEDGADVVITFSATLDGAGAGDATLYRAYAWDGTDRITLRAPGRGTTPPVDLVVFTNIDGDMTVTVPDGVALLGLDAVPAPNQRFLMILQAGVDQLEIAAVGDYPNPIATAGLASNQACQDCHGESGEVGRFAPTRAGGHYSAPMSVDACVVCHTDGFTYGSMVTVAHGIHNSHAMGGFKVRPTVDSAKLYDVTYPTYMANCSVCHSADSLVGETAVTALEAANAMAVTGPGCFTCHGSMDGFDFTGLEFHLQIPDPATADCGQCHDGNLARAAVADFHNGIVTERGGIIFDGADTSVVEGAKFAWTIDGIVDDGETLEISWSASYAGDAVNPCNATLGANAPLFHLGAGANLSMLRSYAQGDDFILGQSTSAPGQANAVNVTADNTTCSGNVATTVIPVDAVDAERGIVALQGKPRVVSVLDPTAGMAVRAKTPTYEWVVGDGAAPLATRRAIADTGECLKCHVGSLYQHGGNRVDNVDMCIICHNPASSEQNVRVGFGVEAAEAYDGLVSQTYEMKTMLHRIHSAGQEGSPPYVLYRTRGIYAWAPDEAGLANWPGTGSQIVYGSDGVTQNHNFHAPTYPRALNACGACHTPDFAVLPDQAKAMATTVDAGGAEWGNQLDDTLQGASTTACVTCHTDAPARGHAFQNSWVPQVFPEGRQTIIDTVQ